MNKIRRKKTNKQTKTPLPMHDYYVEASIPAVIVVQAEISSTHFTDPQLLLLE